LNTQHLARAHHYPQTPARTRTQAVATSTSSEANISQDYTDPAPARGTP
jgi:hypothetical protein